MCIVSTVSSLRVVGNVSVCGVNKVDLRKKTKKNKKKQKKEQTEQFTWNGPQSSTLW